MSKEPICPHCNRQQIRFGDIVETCWCVRQSRADAWLDAELAQEAKEFATRQEKP